MDTLMAFSAECYASVITYISSARMPTSFSLTVKYADSRVRTVVKILQSAAIGKLKNNPLIDWPTCTRRYSKILVKIHLFLFPIQGIIRSETLIVFDAQAAFAPCAQVAFKLTLHTTTDLTNL